MNKLTKILAVLAAFALAQVGRSQTITPAMAVPASAVNTNLPGFKMRVMQGTSAIAQSALLPAERLISGKAIDPATGSPYVNLATPNTDGSFFYDIPGVINMHEQIPNNPDITGGNFFTGPNPPAAPRNVPDEAEPGIPGTTGSGDYFAMEFTGFVQLPAGTVRFGVNSDDGFRLTVGTGINPRINNLQLLILDGTRGFASTEANITVTQAGLYPIRLLFWENTGGNSGVELYAFTPGSTTGNIYLLNDRSQANALRVYREATGNPPTVLNANPTLALYVDPSGNAGGVPPAPYMWVELLDGTTSVNPSTVQFRLDGNNLTVVPSKSGPTNLFGAQAPILASGSLHTNTFIYGDSAGVFFTNTWTFTVSGYNIVTPDYSLPSVDTTKPGFKIKVHQMDVNRNPATGLVPNAERQIANGYINPATGQPYENTADMTSADAAGFFTEPAVVNWNQDNASIGNFPNDTPVPGIGGGVNGTDRYVASIETILQLKAGAYRFGVNSDDGFRLSFGRGPGDVTGIQLATAGDRGVADTYGDVLISQDGNYPVRVMWWETGGGSACEFFVIDLATGRKTLINDASGFTPIKAFRESADSRPYISRVLPTVNYGYTIADQDMVIDVTDGVNPLDANSAILNLNGVAQTITAAKSGKVTTITRKGGVSNLLPSGVVSAQLIYSFTTGGTAARMTNNWTFIVPRYLRPIPPANKVPAAQVSGSGFHVRAVQIDRSKDASQGNGGRDTGNNMPGPEIELAGGYIDPVSNQPYPNLAAPGPNADGSYDVDIFNFSNAQSTGGPANNAGVHSGDTQVPGLPGTGSSNFGLDNSVNEFTTYLELKAGAYVFGLNVDDGWTATSSPNARDTLGTLLGFRNAPGGQNGNPAHNPNAAFNVVVPEDGIYPFRILFWEGGGGVNAEFFSIDRNTGTQILVNDTAGSFPSVVALGGNLSSDIRAYNTYTGPTRPWTKFSVYPMPHIGTIQPAETTATAPTATGAGGVTLWQNRQQQSGPGPISYKLGLLNNNWNSGEIQNSSTATKPFGDAVGAIVADLGTGSVGMVLDGVSVTPTVTDVPGSTDKLVMYTPPTPLASSSNHVAGLVYGGATNYWTFAVQTFVTVNATNTIPSANADPNARGFKVRVAQATATRANTVVAAETQLAGNPVNVAQKGPQPDGSFLATGIINWNTRKVPGQTGAEIGNFQTLLGGPADEPIPGLPGTGAGKDNVSAEIFAYLDLPAGYQKFGVNGDDGWKVQIGTPGVTNGPVLFTIDRGAGAQDIPFAFVTPAAGLYPVRLVWYQGGGDGNLEFFTYGPNNAKIPINSSNPNAVKAYYALSAGTEPPKLSAARQANGSIVLTFEGKLQSADSLKSPIVWQDVAGASPITIASPSGAKFYRAVR